MKNENNQRDEKETAENPAGSKFENQVDSDVNTQGFTKPKGESQTIQEDADTDLEQSDKPGFKRSDS